ncbi:MAG: hypothetical protein HYY76_15885 [Acidobacteria bacterium]|nr:hypothetical protein [Acidobacteriota bacterium]
MIRRYLGSRAAVAVVTTLAALALAVALLELSSTPAQEASRGAFTTPWGEPDLQGIWSVEVQIPLERPAGVTKPFYTEAEVAEIDRKRAAAAHFGDRIAPRGTEADVSGAYNPVFTSVRPTGRRTSLVIDPPDGKIPPLTPEARERQAAYRQYQWALLQATESCKNRQPECAGGTYGPPSPRLFEPPPVYPAAGIGPFNRADGPEDRGLSERCMGGSLPEFRGGFTGIHRRIVQSPGVVYIFYDAGQGQGWSRVVPITTAPHLPSHVRQWWGDSRGRWEGGTLVVDVTNFSPKTDFLGSGENMHYVERWTRTGADTLELVATMNDPTTWTRPWTVQQEFNLQNNEANRIYAEPRCHEGNYGLMALLSGARAAEKAHAEGRGPHPATACLSGCGVDPDGVLDPLALR